METVTSVAAPLITKVDTPVPVRGARQSLSAVVIAYNRADLVGTCLRALSFADELIVFDKSSTDDTPEIAARFADRIVSVPWSPTVEETRAAAVAACRHDWILCLDDDECLSVEAVRWIETELVAPRADVYLLPQRHYILGVHDEAAYYWPEWQPRLFRRSAVTFRSTIHGGTVIMPDAVLHHVSPEAGACMHHLSHRTVAQWVEKTNRYTNNPDRLRADDGGLDLAAFAHARLDAFVAATKTGDRAAYPTAVAVLRATYDIIDRLKTWEAEQGLDGEVLFAAVCRRLEAEYAAALPPPRGGATVPPRSEAVSTQARVSPAEPTDAILRLMETMREAMRHLRAVSDGHERNARAGRAEADDLRQRLVQEGEYAQRIQGELNRRDAQLEEHMRRVELVEQVQRLELEKQVRCTEHAQAQLARRDADCAEMMRAQAALTVAVDELTARTIAAEAQVRAMLGSTSWRVSAPIRRARRLLARALRAARNPRLAVASLARRLGLPNLASSMASHEVNSPPLLPTNAASCVFRPTLLLPADFHPKALRIAAGGARRVLAFGHVPPYPPQAGNEYRLHRLLVWLVAEGYDLLFVLCPTPNEALSSERLAAIAAIYPNVLILEHGGTLHHSLTTHACVLDGLPPSQDLAAFLGEDAIPPSLAKPLELSRAFCPDILATMLRHIDARFSPDLVLAEYVFQTRVFPLLQPGSCKVVDTIDVFSSKAEKVEAFGVSDGLALTAEEERWLAQRADILLAIQPDEAALLRRLVPEARVVSAGVDFLVNLEIGQPPPDPVLLLVASGNPMNAAGLRDFFDFAWPAIRRRVPAAALRVIGAVGETLEEVPDGVSLLGRVPDLAPHYAAARLVINPAPAGTGLKIKTVEALSHLRPVVAWPAGVDGLDPEARDYCAVVNSWAAFAVETIAFLEDDLRAGRLHANRAAVTRLFQPDTVYAALKEALDAA